MLRIYKEGGGKGGLGLEVERWEGVVREIGSEPVSLREMGDAEKKVRCGENVIVNYIFFADGQSSSLPALLILTFVDVNLLTTFIHTRLNLGIELE